MSQFNNSEYQVLVSDLIGDVYYSSTSYRGKVATLRQYAEVVVRKILDIDPRKDITLGSKDIQQGIKALPNNKIVKAAVNKLKKKGNKTTHTKYRGEVTEDEFNNATDGLFDLLSYLFIKYFEKYEFGTNKNIMSVFSILPPIIRYKVLAFLYEKHPNNIDVIDKYVLAMLKAFDAETATSWVEANKEKLSKMPIYSDNAISEVAEQDPSVAIMLITTDISNMYHLCTDKIEKIGATIRGKGLTYSDFESAMPYYKQSGIVQGDTEDIKEFNDIMEFLYMGRRERELLCSSIDDATTVLDVMETSK